MMPDPARYSAATSPDRIASFRFAVAGCKYMLRHQKNVRIILAATLIVCAFAFWLGITKEQWAILILSIGGVWVAEFFNAAIEAVVNLSTSQIHPMARVAKDVAAAAVLITALLAVLIGLLLFGAPLLSQLNAIAASI
ncbi:MAG: diacylglycerol kinase family protein [Chloroflexota bacterium]|nr:diacylglycerol kinase family protein [Chloroflexota bacterium]MDE2907568.1 diacylglycerol kinase family protein [Chloroflexota bacterium]